MNSQTFGLCKLLALILFTLVASQAKSQIFAEFQFHNNLADYSGNGHNGVNNGISFTSDKYGNSNSAAYIDSGTYINIGKLQGIGNVLDTFSISFWFKGDSNHVASSSLFKSINFGNNTNFGLNLNNNTTLANYGVFNLQLRDEDGDQFTFSFVNQACYDGQWHCIVIKVISSANNKAKAFVDGVPQSIILHSIDGPTNYSSDLQYDMMLGVANNRGTLQGYFEGGIDEFVIREDTLAGQDSLGCVIDYCTDTISITQIDTSIFNDTITYNDTLIFRDTLTFNDTIVYQDTVVFNDTFIHRDTLIFYDTLIYRDTSITNLIIYDTVEVAITYNDTIWFEDTVNYTIITRDTILTSICDTIRLSFIDTTCQYKDVSIKLFPNPANSNIILEFNTDWCYSGYSASIWSEIGQKLDEFNITNRVTDIPIYGMAKAVYFIRLYNIQTGKTYILKFIIQ